MSITQHGLESEYEHWLVSDGSHPVRYTFPGEEAGDVFASHTRGPMFDVFLGVVYRESKRWTDSAKHVVAAAAALSHQAAGESDHDPDGFEMCEQTPIMVMDSMADVCKRHFQVALKDVDVARLAEFFRSVDENMQAFLREKRRSKGKNKGKSTSTSTSEMGKSKTKLKSSSVIGKCNCTSKQVEKRLLNAAQYLKLNGLPFARAQMLLYYAEGLCMSRLRQALFRTEPKSLHDGGLSYFEPDAYDALTTESVSAFKNLPIVGMLYM